MAMVSVPIITPAIHASCWEEGVIIIALYLAMWGLVCLGVIAIEYVHKLKERYDRHQEQLRWERATDMGDVYDWRRDLK